jgi:hypothetical protein
MGPSAAGGWVELVRNHIHTNLFLKHFNTLAVVHLNIEVLNLFRFHYNFKCH